MLRRNLHLVFITLFSIIPLTLASSAFADFIPVSISGNVFNDLIGNGIKDAYDPGLSGYEVDLLTSSDIVSATAVTDADGNFSIANIGPGTFTLQEVQQPSYIQTYPAPPGTYSFTTSSGVNLTGNDFGNFSLVTLSGYIYNDLNGNGYQNSGELGLQGWTAQLYDGFFNPVASVLTDASGDFSISNIGPGTYHIGEIMQTGWTQTQPIAPDYYTFTATSGISVLGAVFGNTANTVPEPTSLLLLGTGLGGLALAAWRRRK